MSPDNVQKKKAPPYEPPRVAPVQLDPIRELMSGCSKFSATDPELPCASVGGS